MVQNMAGTITLSAPATDPARDPLATALVKYRAARGKSLADVARAVRLSPAGLGKIERGLCKPNRTTRRRLVKFLRERGYFVAGMEA